MLRDELSLFLAPPLSGSHPENGDPLSRTERGTFKPTLGSEDTGLALYRVSQYLCHKLFLGIPHPHLSKKVPINMGPKVNRFRDIDLRSCAGTRLSVTQDVQSADRLPQHIR